LVNEVIGVDLMPMSSPRSTRQARYAVVILKDENIISKFLNVSRRKLIKLLWTYKPKILALDNVFELGSSRGLLRFLRLLPPQVKIVQVTGSPSKGFISLPNIARRFGLFKGGKLSSLMAAEISARLASMGVGCELMYLSGETKIFVTRERRPGEGGMSEDRYERKVKTAIYNVAKEIESILTSNNIDFDVFYNKDRFGLNNCLFIVYSPLNTFRGLIKSVKSSDVKVSIKRVYSRKFIFKPLSDEVEYVEKPGNYLIVGVDPGIVAGVAVLDLYGKLLFIKSRRHWSRSELLSTILDLGNPILIASDVHPPPAFVSKLASILNVHVFYPPRNLTVSEKKDILNKYMEEFNLHLSLDSHERDALAAAVKAFMNFRNKFVQAEAHARERAAHISTLELRALIVKGYNIRDAINRLLSLETEVKSCEETSKISEPPKYDSEIIKKLREKLKVAQERVKKLLLQRDNLLEKISFLEGEIEKLRKNMLMLQDEAKFKLRRDREISSLESRVRDLQLLVSSLEGELSNLNLKMKDWRNFFVKFLRGDLLVLKPVKNLSSDDVNSAVKKYKISRGDSIYISDLSIADYEAIKRLSKLGVKCIVSSINPPPHILDLFDEFMIPLISGDMININFWDDFPYVDRDRFESLVASVLEKLKQKKELEEERRLRMLFEEYKKSRIKELKDVNFSRQN